MPKFRGGISPKQKQFAKAYVKSGFNGQQSALEIYDTKDKHVAQVIASENLSKPVVAREVSAILEQQGWGLDTMTDQLKEVATMPVERKVSANERLRAIEMGLKLHNAFPASRSVVGHVNLNKQYESLSVTELQEQLTSMKQLREEIAKDAT